MARDAAYVAVYDVTSDRERNRLAKVLEGFGLRVQYSAFELRLTPATRRTLIRRIEELKLQSGFVYLYRRAGSQDRTAIGQAPDDPLAETNHAFVVAATPKLKREKETSPPSGRQTDKRRPKSKGAGRKPSILPDTTAVLNPVLPIGFLG